MTLQYGHLHMNHQFVEDDDGNDAFIQYGICTNSIQTIVSEERRFELIEKYSFFL